MQVVVIKKEKLYKYPFPNEFVSNYWIKDNDEFGNERNLIMLAKRENSWFLIANDVCRIIEDSKEVNETDLNLNKFYLLKINSKNSSTNAIIYICNENDASYNSYEIISNGEYTIGSSPNKNIILNSINISEDHAIITRDNNSLSIKAIDTNFGIYVNDHRENYKRLENGDIVFIMGYKIIVLNDYIIVNSYANGISINSPNIISRELPKYNGELLPTTDDDNAEAKQAEEDHSEVELILEKNRAGARGTVHLMFIKSHNKFTSIAPEAFQGG